METINAISDICVLFIEKFALESAFTFAFKISAEPQLNPHTKTCGNSPRAVKAIYGKVYCLHVSNEGMLPSACIQNKELFLGI